MHTAHTIHDIMKTARRLNASPSTRERARRIAEDMECVAPSDVALAFDLDSEDEEI